MEGLTRLPGESSEDWNRRYHREKMRRKRAAIKAANPDAPRRLRGKNKAPSKGGSLTHEEWEALQPLPGESPEEHKKRYAREIMRRWREKNPGKEAAKRREAYPQIREQEIARHKQWREDHPERFKESQHRYYLKNKEKRIAALKKWGEENPERLAQLRERWYHANRAKRNAYSAKWRALRNQATPPWANLDAIEVVYQEAIDLTNATGVPHHVDHDRPLNSKLVCGLHVHYNLRVVPATENIKKRNTLLDRDRC